MPTYVKSSVISKVSLVLDPESESKPQEYIEKAVAKAVYELCRYVKTWLGSGGYTVIRFVLFYRAFN